MRGSLREQFMLVGKVLLLCSLATSALVAAASNRLGWTNYWGGVVYAPFALLVAVLVVVAIAKKRDGIADRPSRRRT
jgi:hypothetical protein